jgi:gliding motility-associated-like protein/fimbrial isopeptide formation D2 family protein
MNLRESVIATLLGVVTLTSAGQQFVSEISAPSENFINEEVCWSVTFSHVGIPGYQPYLRLFLPPEIPYTAINTNFMGNPITGILDGGEVSGGFADDPNLGENNPDNMVSGPDGHRLLVINIPVGSMVENGVSLSLEVCGTLNGPAATLGTPVDVIACMVYRYGNSPMGENGSIVGAPLSASITPTLYRMSKGVDKSDLPTGSCWDFSYNISVDIADQMLITDLEINDILPDNIQYLGLMDITPGCIVEQEPSLLSPGGILQVTCDNSVGTIDPADVGVSFMAYMTDVLDPMSCDSLQFLNSATGSSNEGANLSSTTSTYGYHLALSTGDSGGGGVPGATSQAEIEFNISEYVDGINGMIMDLTVPDGLAYIGSAMFNGVPISSPTINGPTNGVTTLSFDLVNEDGTNFSPCETGFVSFGVQFQENYFNGDALMARDPLSINGSLNYSLENGNPECSQPIAIGYSVESVEVLKEVISTPALGDVYVPGENVTYRLTMHVPSEDVKDIVFEDLFPLPVHDVASIDLTFGNDINWSGLDNCGITPSNIYIEEATNKLFIEWGDVTGPTTGLPKIISCEINVEVTAEPSASGLSHSNFARFYSSNSALDNQAAVSNANIVVAAPSLSIYKGVQTTNNPDQVIAPIVSPVDGDVSGIDAWDWLTYHITLVNDGAAPAYDVIVHDFPDNAYLDNCTMIDVTTGSGTPLAYSGNLFTTGLVIDEIERDQAADEADEAVVMYQCQVKGDVEVRSEFQNYAEVTWAATAGNPIRFDPVTDISKGTIAEPKVIKSIKNIQPGYAGADHVHIGEIVTYEIEITIPEGNTRSLSISDILPEGLSTEDLVAIEVDEGISLQFTPSSIFNNATIADLGVAPEDERRHITMTIGDVDNDQADNFDDEKIRISYRALVLNWDGNQSGTELTDNLSVLFNDPVADQIDWIPTATTVEVVEPKLKITSSFFNDQLIPGETTFLTLHVQHAETSAGTAYDVNILNDLQLGLEFVDDSFILECEELLAAAPTESFGAVSARWDSIPVGVDCQISFGVKVSEAYPPCSFIDNSTMLDWSSTWVSHMDTLSYGPAHALGYERTGNINDIGGFLNDYNEQTSLQLEVISDAVITPVISGSDAACNGQNITLTIPEYTGIGVVYHWSGPSVPPGFNDNEFTLNDLSAADVGDYNVWVEIGDCSTDQSNTVSIQVNELPILDLPDIDIACSSGTEDVIISPEITGGFGPFDYFWTGPNYASTDAEAVIPNAGEDDEGVYTLYVTDDNGCISNTATSTVAVNNSPVPPEISQPDDLCEGQSLEFTCTAYAGDVNYHWETPGGQVITAGPTLFISEPDAMDSGEYTVWIEVNECNTIESAQANVAVTALPGSPDLELSDSEICEGESLVLSTSTTADAYHWTGPNGYESFLSTPPVINVAGLFEAGTYTLTVTVNSCSSTSSTSDLTVLARPETPGFTNNSPLCEGENLVLETSDSASEYIWIDPNGDQYITAEGAYTLNGVIASDSGGYTLMIYDGVCYSAASDQQVVVIEGIPQIQAFGGDDIYVCNDGQGALGAINDSPYSGVWSVDDPTITIVNPDSETSNVLGAVIGESYELTWSLYNEGCGVFSSDLIGLIAPESPLADIDEYALFEGEFQDLFVLYNDEFGGELVNVYLVEEPLHGTANVGLNEYFIYQSDEGYNGSDEFTYEICLDECPNICDTAVVRLEVAPFLSIPDVITPNGDGSNDTFYIEGIENFETTELCIYNRWGHQVFQARNYQNDWMGTWDGKELPEGTYYYVFLEQGINEAIAQGYVVIHR